MTNMANNWVQATPGWVVLFFLSLGFGAPDPERWPSRAHKMQEESI